jgi:hypothetical protein
VESPRGLRFAYPSRKAAITSRFALYTARNINREEMKEIFPPDDPSHGKSPWDAYRLTIELDQKNPSNWVLIVARHSDAQFTPVSVTEI